MKDFFESLKKRYHYAMVVFKELVKTDFQLRYQGSFLGMVWSVLKPLMLFAVMYVVFVKFLKFSDGTPTFPISLLCGTCLWSFFSESTSMGMQSIVGRGDLLRKILVPRDHRRKAARILAARAIIHESCNKLILHQVVDDDMERILRKERIIRVAQRDFHDFGTVQRPACFPQQLHHCQLRICQPHMHFFALHTTSSLGNFRSTFYYEYSHRSIIIYSIFLFLQIVKMYIRENQ